jgi:hypothetical protein
MGKILIFNAETNEWEYNSTGTGELAADIQFTDTAKGVILKAPDGGFFLSKTHKKLKISTGFHRNPQYLLDLISGTCYT